MSESAFLNRHIRNFCASHPYHQGWKVYELPGDRARKGYLHFLLDFVRDVHPDSIVERLAMKELASDESAHGPSSLYYHAAEPGTDWDLSKELDSTDWYGLVHIQWGEHQIHCLSILMKYGEGYTTVYHIATQSNVALRQILAELEGYGKARNKEEGRYVYVVNGDDMPILPVSWEDVLLPTGLAEAIRGDVAAFFQCEERYRSLGIPYRRGLLFTGPPGCGKTFTLKALIHAAAAKTITVLGKANVEDHHIAKAFRMAMKHAPAIVVFEDLDKLIRSQNVSLAHFLNMLDGLRTLSGIMVIATSNEPELLDPALLHRPSRFDRVWTFPLPAREQRLAFLRKRCLGHFSDSTLSTVADASHGFSMAYVQEIVINAFLETAQNGSTPTDTNLMRSLHALRSQRQQITKKLESLAEPESVGFALPSHAGICSGEKEG
jgi:hypothetical protein